LGEVLSRLRASIPKNGLVDANGAALIAMAKVQEEFEATEVMLEAFTWIDPAVQDFLEPRQIDSHFDTIQKMDELAPRARSFGIGLHSRPIYLFKIRADAETLVVQVTGKDAELLPVGD